MITKIFESDGEILETWKLGGLLKVLWMNRSARWPEGWKVLNFQSDISRTMNQLRQYFAFRVQKPGAQFIWSSMAIRLFTFGVIFTSLEHKTGYVVTAVLGY